MKSLYEGYLRVKCNGKDVNTCYTYCYTCEIAIYKARKLKVQSCKLWNSKYMIASTQTTNTEIFAFIAFPVFNLLSHKVLFIRRKDNRNCLKVDYFLRK